MHLLLYDYVVDVLERRAPHREAHLALIAELADAGEVLLAGATGDPVSGAAFAFRTAQSARDFVARDPYVEAGLVTAWRVEPWNVVAGALAP